MRFCCSATLPGSTQLIHIHQSLTQNKTKTILRSKMWFCRTGTPSGSTQLIQFYIHVFFLKTKQQNAVLHSSISHNKKTHTITAWVLHEKLFFNWYSYTPQLHRLQLRPCSTFLFYPFYLLNGHCWLKNLRRQ